MLDDTTFTLGPRSNLVLDEFVYDPHTQNGEIAVSIAKGVFRFITGKIVERNPEKMKVKMAVGYIGIRGTTVLGETSSSNSFVALEKTEGKTNNGSHVVVGNQVGGRTGETHLTEYGYGVRVKKGEAPGKSFKVPEEDLSRLRGKLNPPSDGDKGSSSFGEGVGIGNVGSGSSVDTSSIHASLDKPEGVEGSDSSYSHG